MNYGGNTNLELHRFSLGCYSLNLIWAICNKCWEFLGIWFILLIVNIIFNFPKPFGYIIFNIYYFVFAFFGLKIAYKRQKLSINNFLKRQLIWDIVGGLFFIANITYLIYMYY